MDILKYAIFKAASDVQVCIAGGANTAANISGCLAGNAAGVLQSANTGSLYNDNVFWTQANVLSRITCSQCTQYYLNTMPWCHCYWLGIPRFPNSSNTSNAGINPLTGTEYSGFKVCATCLWSGSSGTCCLWTVPAGTSYARFQIWGSGGSSGSGCCCGGSTWGTNGAYASVIIPVGAGSTYTLCAGSAWCLPTCWGNNLCVGCPSFVIGSGLTNFCAQGASWKNHWCHLLYDNGANYYSSGCCRWASPDCAPGSGACMCNTGSDYCYSGSCAWCGWIGPSANKVTNYFGNTSVAAANVSIVANTTGAASNTYFQVGGQVLGIPGLNTLCECFETNYYGCSTAAPIYGFELVNISSSFCSTSSSCGGPGCSKFNSNRLFPGAGGTYTHLMAGCTMICCATPGCTYCGGDLGRDGMVCVTYF